MLQANQAFDPIKDVAIEKQLFDLLSPRIEVSYKIADRFILILEGGDYEIHKRKKDVQLIGGYDQIFSYNLPSYKLPFNQNIEKQLDKICSNAVEIRSIKKQLQEIPPANEVAIRSFLNERLSTNSVDVSFWLDRDCPQNKEVTFYLHPKGKNPADGVLVCINNGKIEPWWNGSTKTRTTKSCRQDVIEQAVGEHKLDQFETMVEKIRELKEKIDKFDVTECPELMEYIVNREIAAILFQQFKELFSEFKGLFSE